MIVKFIRKEKVLKDSWIEDERLGKIPLEVHLLSYLAHPNIVTVCDVLCKKNKNKILYQAVTSLTLRLPGFFTVFGHSLKEARVLHKEALVVTLLGIPP